MSARQFKGKPCVYCSGARSAVTGDHVFARQFFPVAERGNLPQAPTCDACNNAKSGHENYLTAVISFGGKHKEAASDLETMVPPRLNKNLKLQRQLAQGMKHVWQKSPGGVLLPALTLPFEAEQIERWAEYVVRGLIWHHWQIVIPADHVVSAACLSSFGAETFAALFAMHVRNRVSGYLGDGRFIYRGVQGTDDAALTLWEIAVLNGINLGDDPTAGGEISVKLGCVTGSKRVGNLFTALGMPPAKPPA